MLSQIWLGQKSVQYVGQRVCLPGWRKQPVAALSDNPADTGSGDVACDHRAAVVHGLEEHQAKGFAAVDRGEAEDVAGGHQSLEL